MENARDVSRSIVDCYSPSVYSLIISISSIRLLSELDHHFALQSFFIAAGVVFRIIICFARFLTI